MLSCMVVVVVALLWVVGRVQGQAGGAVRWTVLGCAALVAGGSLAGGGAPPAHSGHAWWRMVEHGIMAGGWLAEAPFEPQQRQRPSAATVRPGGTPMAGGD